MPQSNPASRSATVRRAVPLVAVLAIGFLALSACGKRAPADPTGYFGQTPDRIAFVEWNQTKPTSTGTSSLSGTATLATVDNQALSLQSDAVPLTGTLDNQTTVSIKLDRALDGSASWSGTLSGSRLTLSYTDGAGNVVTLPLLAASRSAYNVAVATEQQVLVDQKSGKVTSNASNAQEKAVDKWSKAVQADLAKLAADSAAVSGQVAAVTAANTSANAFKASAHHYLVDALKFKYGPQICPIANQSSASANSSSAQASAATAGKDRIASLSGAVRKDIANLTSDHGKLAAAQAAAPRYKPKGLPTDNEVNNAVNSANSAIADAQHTANGAANAATGKASTAQGYASQAQAACAAAPQQKTSSP